MSTGAGAGSMCNHRGVRAAGMQGMQGRSCERVLGEEVQKKCARVGTCMVGGDPVTDAAAAYANGMGRRVRRCEGGAVDAGLKQGKHRLKSVERH